MSPLGLDLSQSCWPSSPKALRSAIERVLAATAKRQFRYASLLREGYIRLLAIDVGTGEDQICTRLVTYPLESAPEYVALSYTWGDLNDTLEILCHGQQLSITRNLRAALSRLRDQCSCDCECLHVDGIDMGVRYLWVDAICINQSDVVEKTEQVRLMARIFNKASWAIGWLGEKESAAEEGIRLMKQLQDIFDLEVWRDPNTQSDKPAYHNLKAEDLIALGVPGGFEPAWDSLVSLWELKWFSRIWIVQELLCAQDFVFLYGNKFLSAVGLLRVARIFYNNLDLGSVFAARFRPIIPKRGPAR